MGLCFSNKVDSALIATIIIAGLTFLYNSYRERRIEREVRKRYLLALKEEIDLNINGLEKFVFPPMPRLREYLRADRKNRPLITFHYSSIIFSNRTEILQDLPDALINSIVDFYGKLESIRGNVAAIDKDAFETISDDGREAAISSLVILGRLALQHGQSLITQIRLLGRTP